MGNRFWCRLEWHRRRFICQPLLVALHERNLDLCQTIKHILLFVLQKILVSTGKVKRTFMIRAGSPWTFGGRHLILCRDRSIIIEVGQMRSCNVTTKIARPPCWYYKGEEHLAEKEPIYVEPGALKGKLTTVKVRSFELCGAL
jgi:hypothetical protein